ncbi:MAG: Gfo/Idh/MocA family oxidoreductase [Bacteroidetes bacterium]|nr:Gfo/Idh/MocA family oxidoreductase [Bacteroidota bacterium]
MLKIGVLGAGHLGKIHIKLLQELDSFDLVGIYDPSQENADKAVKDFGVKSFKDIDDLLTAVDVIDIVTPTLSHYECAIKGLKQSKHVFIEKPMTNTLAEAKDLLKLSEEAQVKVQIGHVERFNPALTAALPYLNNPLFIETHRLAQFNPRGTDVPVVLDLMIHDIDICLHIIKANVKRISANGVAVVSEEPDIANARIEFDNGCVANLTASRISMRNMRKMRIFQADGYFAVDFAKKETEVFRLVAEQENGKDEADHPITSNPLFSLEVSGMKKFVKYEKPKIKEVNAIKLELELFNQAIVEDSDPPVPVIDGYNAMNVAYEIIDQIEHNVLI